MATQRLALPPPLPFTPAEMKSLEALRRRHQEDGDLFTKKERNTLSFLRWLYTSGRIPR